jgi:polyhydroxyalkanoate synthase subunit PhaC
MMFRLIDAARRQAGMLLDGIGFGMAEAPYRIAADLEGARVRAYQAGCAPDRPVLLIISAPFKQPYIWDLAPPVSVIRRCRSCDVQVYLLEWTIPGPEQDHLGLADYADRLVAAACEVIEAESGRTAIIVAGHSLSGTFAAIFASLHPERVCGLVLIDAPIDFGDEGGAIARLVATSPHARMLRLMVGSPVPGSAIGLLSAAALPAIFLWQPATDLIASCVDAQATEIHIRVVRWTLDEFPVPGQLFEDVFERLYRENRFLRGSLVVGRRRAGVERLRCPVLAVINPAGGVVPPASVQAAMHGTRESCVLTYEGARGASLQHVGPLVAPRAHERLWPTIIAWLAPRCRER